jgi:hypothetical protein
MTRARTENSRNTFDIADLNSTIDGQPRMLDLTLAGALGFANFHMIRKLISRHAKPMERFGRVVSIVEKTTERGGRPGKAYYLNKKQALYICTKSDTENATEVTIQMVEVFDAYTSDKPIHVREHERRTSTKVDDAIRLKKSIDRIEAIADRVQPPVQNLCAMVVNGQPVFIDTNAHRLHNELAVVMLWGGELSIEVVETDARDVAAFGNRSAYGPWRDHRDGTRTRPAMMVIGKVVGQTPIEAQRERHVDEVTGRLTQQITMLLEAGPYTDAQIAKHLCCAPKIVRDVRRVQSAKPAIRVERRLM